MAVKVTKELIVPLTIDPLKLLKFYTVEFDIYVEHCGGLGMWIIFRTSPAQCDNLYLKFHGTKRPSSY